MTGIMTCHGVVLCPALNLSSAHRPEPRGGRSSLVDRYSVSPDRPAHLDAFDLSESRAVAQVP